MLFGHEVEDFEIGVTGICKVVGDMCGDVHRQTSFQGDLLAADFPNTFSANDIEELLGTVQVQTAADVGLDGGHGHHPAIGGSILVEKPALEKAVMQLFGPGFVDFQEFNRYRATPQFDSFRGLLVWVTGTE